MRFTLLFTVLCLVFRSYGQEGDVRSHIEIYHLETGEVTTVLSVDRHFEAPNWSPGGKHLIINSGGLLYRMKITNGKSKQIPTGALQGINNDHGISPDGDMLVVSNNDPSSGDFQGGSRIYTLPIRGGTPQLVTPKAPSYWHGWSPDGETLAYVADRNGDYDIYTIPVGGGEETRLTSEAGLDDGPDYSPDGKYIFYNSMASGKMELWRMDADGSDKVQLTDDSYSNWFPHPSPDGKFLVYISYLEDQGSAHPPMKDVALRLYDLETKEITTLVEFTGGQGTINVPSWSPDSRAFAFVRYEFIR